MALTVAGTRFPPSYCAILCAARMLAAINSRVSCPRPLPQSSMFALCSLQLMTYYVTVLETFPAVAFIARRIVTAGVRNARCSIRRALVENAVLKDGQR
jgi:hypothetical protein